MTCDEAQELITALVDRELLDPERTSLESHLRECPDCRLAVEQEQFLKQAIRGRAQRMSAPHALRDRILADHRVFPEKSHPRRRDHAWLTPGFATPALAAALILALALPAFLLLKPGSEPIAAAAVEAYDILAKYDLAAPGTEKPDEIVERLVREVSGHFHPMGYDLTGSAFAACGRHGAGNSRPQSPRRHLPRPRRYAFMLHVCRVGRRCATQLR